MKFILIYIFISTSLFAKIYYSKVNPYELRNVMSEVQGKVLLIDESMIGKSLGAEPYVLVDSSLDTYELASTKTKLLLLKKTLKINSAMLSNLQNLLLKKRKNYQSIKNLKFKSTIEKNREFYELISSENLFLSTKKEINNLSLQIADLQYKSQKLKRTIKDKSFTGNGFVLYSIDVKIEQIVSKSTLIAKIANLSKAKLTIYLDYEDLKNIEKKIVYIDGIATTYRVSRIIKVTDLNNISKYKAEIIIKSPKIFSRLVKIELIDKDDNK